MFICLFFAQTTFEMGGSVYIKVWVSLSVSTFPCNHTIKGGECKNTMSYHLLFKNK